MSDKSNPPKISVLIPVYNVEKYVERCILSVLNQTMQEGVEVIIVNDCTPDRSMEIIREALRTHLKENGITVRIVEHEKNRGQAAVRNTAMSYATGDYTIHVDSDDYVELDMLEKMYDKALETDADIVMADRWLEYLDKSIYEKSGYIHGKTQLLKKIIRGELSPNLCIKLIRRSLYVNNSIYWIEGKNCGEDYSVMAPLFFFADKIVYYSQAFYHYVQYNPSSITTRKPTQHEFDDWLFMVEHVEKFINKENITGCEEDVLWLKLITKLRLMLYSGAEQFEVYSELYPEADEYRRTYLKQMNQRFDIKLLSYLGLYKHSFLYRIVLNLKCYIKKYYYL